MKILYFAWLRQKIGIGEEKPEVPATVTTPAQLVDWLKSRGSQYEAAFKDVTAIKVAINQEFADFNSPIQTGDEIAFFPPVTGG